VSSSASILAASSPIHPIVIPLDFVYLALPGDPARCILQSTLREFIAGHHLRRLEANVCNGSEAASNRPKLTDP